MTRLWFKQNGERTYHALRRMDDTLYVCGKITDKLTIVEQDKYALSGQLCNDCFIRVLGMMVTAAEDRKRKKRS